VEHELRMAGRMIVRGTTRFCIKHMSLPYSFNPISGCHERKEVMPGGTKVER
jgi:hypothetical protein